MAERRNPVKPVYSGTDVIALGEYAPGDTMAMPGVIEAATGGGAAAYMEGFGNQFAAFGSATNTPTVVAVNKIEKSRFTEAGDFGVGTKDPIVRGDFHGVDYTAIRAYTTTNGVDARLQTLGSASKGYVGTVSNHPFSVITNNEERIMVAANGDVICSNPLEATNITSRNVTTRGSLNLEGGFAIVHRFPNDNAGSTVTFDANNIQFLGEYATSTVSCDILGNGSGHRYAGVGSTTGGNNLSNIMAMGWAGSSVQFRVDATVLPVGTLSDSRVKTNINPATGFLEKVLQLNPVFYSYSASQAKSIAPIVLDSADHLGFIAQEVELVIPEAVTHADPEDADSLRGLDPIPLISALVAAIQELSAKVAALEAAATK
jgi:hypothetical protein